MIILRRAAPAALVLALFFPGLAPGQAPERHVLEGAEVAVYNLAGRVMVEAGTGSAVVAEVTRGGSDAARLRVVVGQVSVGHPRSARTWNALRVIYPGQRVVYAAGNGQTNLRVRADGVFFDGDDESADRVRVESRGSGLQAHADLRVLVPAGRRVALRLAVGAVVVENVNGSLDIETGSASVRTSRTRGGLRIDVGSGSLDLSDAEGDVEVESGSGDVSLARLRGTRLSVETGSGGVRGTGLVAEVLKVETGSGGIHLGEVRAPEAELETGSGDVRVELQGEVRSLRIETGSGGVTLLAPPGLAAEVDIETGSGDIESDFPVAVTRHERHHLRGRIGAGGGRIDIETGSGGVRLRRR